MADLDAFGATAALAARLVLAALFLTAGLTKLARPQPAAIAAVRFRVARRASTGVGVGLGVTEVIMSVLLVSPDPVALAGCVLAGAMSLGFLVVSVAALRRGERFTCACLSEREQLSWATAARAAAMVFAAIVGGIGERGYPTEPAVLVDAVTLAVIAVGLPLTVRLAMRMRSVSAQGRRG